MDQEIALREKVRRAVVEYYEFKQQGKQAFAAGDRISYGGRFFDEQEICNLVESSLDFWLTTGRYCREFEARFAQFLGVKYCSLTNSGSSANH